MKSLRETKKIETRKCNQNRYPDFEAVLGTVKLGDKEHFDKEQIGVKEPFSVTNC